MNPPNPPAPRPAHPPTFQDYHRQATGALASMSRTAAGKVETEAKGKPGLAMAPGEALKQKANANFSAALKHVHEVRNRAHWTPEHVKQLVHHVAHTVTDGIIPKDQGLWRQHTTPEEYRQSHPRDIPKHMDEFHHELARRLNDPKAHPTDTAAFIAERFDGRIHPLVDGCGRATKALSALPHMRAGHHLPSFPGRAEYYGAMKGTAEHFRQQYHGWTHGEGRPVGGRPELEKAMAWKMGPAMRKLAKAMPTPAHRGPLSFSNEYSGKFGAAEHRIYYIHTGGKKVGSMEVYHHPSTGETHIGAIGIKGGTRETIGEAPQGNPHSVGVRGMRQVVRHLRGEFPATTHLTGQRESGATIKAGKNRRNMRIKVSAGWMKALAGLSARLEKRVSSKPSHGSGMDWHSNSPGLNWSLQAHGDYLVSSRKKEPGPTLAHRLTYRDHRNPNRIMVLGHYGTKEAAMRAATPHHEASSRLHGIPVMPAAHHRMAAAFPESGHGKTQAAWSEARTAHGFERIQALRAAIGRRRAVGKSGPYANVSRLAEALEKARYRPPPVGQMGFDMGAEFERKHPRAGGAHVPGHSGGEFAAAPAATAHANFYHAVPCRNCKAKVGEPCQNVRVDMKHGVHAVRRVQAEEEAAKAHDTGAAAPAVVPAAADATKVLPALDGQQLSDGSRLRITDHGYGSFSVEVEHPGGKRTMLAHNLAAYVGLVAAQEAGTPARQEWAETAREVAGLSEYWQRAYHWAIGLEPRKGPRAALALAREQRPSLQTSEEEAQLAAERGRRLPRAELGDAAKEEAAQFAAAQAERRAEYERFMQAPCPVCRAGVGEKCVNWNGVAQGMAHLDRQRAAHGPSPAPSNAPAPISDDEFEAILNRHSRDIQVTREMARLRSLPGDPNDPDVRAQIDRLYAEQQAIHGARRAAETARGQAALAAWRRGEANTPAPVMKAGITIGGRRGCPQCRTPLPAGHSGPNCPRCRAPLMKRLVLLTKAGPGLPKSTFVHYAGHSPHAAGGHGILFHPPSPSGKVGGGVGSPRMKSSGITHLSLLHSTSDTHGLYSAKTASGSRYTFVAPHAHMRMAAQLSGAKTRRSKSPFSQSNIRAAAGAVRSGAAPAPQPLKKPPLPKPAATPSYFKSAALATLAKGLGQEWERRNAPTEPKATGPPSLAQQWKEHKERSTPKKKRRVFLKALAEMLEKARRKPPAAEQTAFDFDKEPDPAPAPEPSFHTWQIPRQQFADESVARYAAARRAAGKEPFPHSEGQGSEGYMRMTAGVAHHEHVKRALAEGKPVAPEVHMDWLRAHAKGITLRGKQLDDARPNARDYGLPSSPEWQAAHGAHQAKVHALKAEYDDTLRQHNELQARHKAATAATAKPAAVPHHGFSSDHEAHRYLSLAEETLKTPEDVGNAERYHAEAKAKLPTLHGAIAQGDERIATHEKLADAQRTVQEWGRTLQAHRLSDPQKAHVRAAVAAPAAATAPAPGWSEKAKLDHAMYSS